MRLGKLDNDTLERLVLSKFQKTRAESLHAPEIGEDCAWLDLGTDLAVLSCDPITSASIAHLGRLTVHVNCNDAAAAGAEPVGLLVTLLAPPSLTEEQIGRIADDLAAAASLANVDILGGHTEVTDAVTRPVTSTAVVARCPRERLMRGMQIGDDIVMTKWAGLEGTSIIAEDFPALAGRLDAAQRASALALQQHLSVTAEGHFGVTHGAAAMHDITEGGVLGACWEMAHLAGCGMRIDVDAIPILPETQALCDAAGINPLRLISSGSLLIACPDGNAMTAGLRSAGIPATVIARAVEGDVRQSDGSIVAPPEADELYRLFP